MFESASVGVGGAQCLRSPSYPKCRACKPCFLLGIARRGLKKCWGGGGFILLVFELASVGVGGQKGSGSPRHPWCPACKPCLLLGVASRGWRRGVGDIFLVLSRQLLDCVV